MPATADTQPSKNVFVYTENAEALQQPATFQVCPLGVQLYTREIIEEFHVLQVRISVPRESAPPIDVECSGIVVHCQPVPGQDLHRLWVKFLDLPEPTRNEILCLAKDEHKCPYCENF